MDIQAITSSARLGQPTAATPPIGDSKSEPENKLKESCRQFEAILWRSMLEKSNAANESEEGQSADKTGTYQYFINDTIANSVSGLPSSFSSVLFATLSPHLHPKDPS